MVHLAPARVVYLYDDSICIDNHDRDDSAGKVKASDCGKPVCLGSEAKGKGLMISMRELLEKAHQQDEDDLFKEEENDEEFAAPGGARLDGMALMISREGRRVSGRFRRHGRRGGTRG